MKPFQEVLRNIDNSGPCVHLEDPRDTKLLLLVNQHDSNLEKRNTVQAQLVLYNTLDVR
jgi:hypothetical protein